MASDTSPPGISDLRIHTKRLDCCMDEECLIVGAGPTGLTLAIELRRFGLTVRLIDKAERPARWSQALVVQARTLEQFDRYGIADQAVAQGRKISKAQIWSNANQIASLDFQRIPSRFPYLLFLPQNETEELLTAHLRSLGVEDERQVELISFENTGDVNRIWATLRHPDGRQERTSFRWLIGCDGAHSTVRAGMRVAFEGTTSSLNFQLGDLSLAGQDLPGDELQVHLHRSGDVLAVGRLQDGIYRVVLALHRQKQPISDECLSSRTLTEPSNAAVSESQPKPRYGRRRSRLIRGKPSIIVTEACFSLEMLLTSIHRSVVRE